MIQYRNIQEQFTKVMEYSQGGCFDIFPEMDFSGLFERWRKNKSNLMFTPFFDEENLIYEYPEKVSFGLDENTKQERLNRFVKELWDFPFLQDFCGLISLISLKIV